jgi:photosystem II stability/assembly factor-like uncharacterized protein
MIGRLGVLLCSALAAACDVEAVLGRGDGDGTGGAGAAGGEPIGVWQDVTPEGLSLDPDFHPATNFGVQDVLADPARPSDLYAFVCYQGVWRSEDHGLSWTKVSHGQNGALLESGRPWTAVIERDPARDPSTPPKLYTALGGSADHGVFVSVDGGVSWARFTIDDPVAEICCLDVDPYDPEHLLAGLHLLPGLLESSDGGATWQTVTSDETMGMTLVPMFVDTGDAATTASTWLTQAEWAGGANGIYRTEDGGGAWQNVEGLEHPTGAGQPFQSGSVLYAAGAYGSEGDGIYRSADLGTTWVRVVEDERATMFGSDAFVYGAASGATVADNPPKLVRSSVADGIEWTMMETPAAMTNGPKRVAATRKDGRNVLVGGNFNAGIWRYIE